MTAYVALLYSVILPEGKRLKMIDLMQIAEQLGFKNARTYGASGNLLFETRTVKNRNLEIKLEDAYEAHLGRRVDIIMRTAAEWRSLAAGNPFPEESKAEGSNVSARIMRHRIPATAEKALQELCTQGEKARVVNGDFWGYFPEGISGSKLLQQLTPKRQGVGTLRNANVVQAIADLLDG